MKQMGRKKIYTDITEIMNVNQVFKVLEDSLPYHYANVADMKLLLSYEKGDQPILNRKKNIRKDVNNKIVDNVANQITEFKLGYNWGNPITLSQRGSKDLNNSNSDKDDNAVGMLNEMLDDEGCFSKDQDLARYIEIVGIGYRYVDMKHDYDGGSVFDLYTLNPLHTFVVYANNVTQRPVLGVMYRTTKDGQTLYTCFTDELRYEVKLSPRMINGHSTEKLYFTERARSGEMNPWGMIPIIEYIRSYDRMGCFERQLSDMNALNVLVSDFSNQVTQTTQTLWWANDVQFPKDDEGNVQQPESGDWISTETPPHGDANGRKPNIKPMSVLFDYSGITNDIKRRRDTILQKCDVPLRSEPGGGSTGSAMSMSSGWSAAEVAACKESQIIRQARMRELRLILRIINKSGKYLDANNPLRDLKISDIEPQFKRNKTYDMITKVNAYATLINNMVDGRDALKVIDLFSDPQQVWNDSKKRIEDYQDSKIKNDTPSTLEPQEEGTDKFTEDIKKNLDDQDLSDQASNSPVIGK